MNRGVVHLRNGGFPFLRQGLCRNVSTVVYTWGEGSDGQLGHAKFEKKSTTFSDSVYIQEEPRKLVKSKRFQSISIGENYSLGLTHTGELFGWGNKEFFDKSQNILEPTLVNTVTKIAGIGAGQKHAAIYDVNGKVYTWGEAGHWLRGGGMLGHGDKTKQLQPKLIQAFDVYGAKAKAVACAGHHTLILTDDGEVLSCGVGEYGRLGTGSTSDSLIPLPLESLANEDVVQIAVGLDHSLALTSNGSVFSWGRNQSGQLGHLDSYLDIYSMEDFPRVIEAADGSAGDFKHDMHSFKQIAASSGRSAAVTVDGLLYVWGARLSNAPRLIQKDLLDGMKVVKVACGGDASHSVIAFITEDGGLWTMGDANSHMLGAASSGKQANPKRVLSLAGKVVTDISCGSGKHMAAFVAADDE